MSYTEFNKVWTQKFPGSQLPAAWEEDVKTNLAKHKKRVTELQEELDKEQVYVQFLESLLEEVEKRKGESNADQPRVGSHNSNGSRAQEQNINDVIKDTLERRSLSYNRKPIDTSLSGTVNSRITAQDQQAGKLSSSAKIETVLEDREVARSSSSERKLNTKQQSTKETASKEDRSIETVNLDDVDEASGDEYDDGNPNEVNKEQVDEDEAVAAVVPPGEGDGLKKQQAGSDHFVTVIEVNGFEKEKLANASNQKQRAVNNNSNSNEEMKRLKKIPPRPPPKLLKRPDQVPPTPQGASRSSPDSATGADMYTTGGPLSKSNVDQRPVIFDSRKNSSAAGGTNTGTNSSSSSNGSNGPQQQQQTDNANVNPGSKSQNFNNSHQNNSGIGFAAKRFEGSRCPLPPTTTSSSSSSSGSGAQQNDLDEKILNPGKAHRYVPPNSDHHNASHSHTQSNDKENPNVRSKILDLVNKMESSHKPMALSKNIEQLTPKRSNSSFRKHLLHQQQPPMTSSTKYQQQISSSDSIVSDYVDPCDAEFDLNNDQIYDSPPPEDSEEDPTPMQAEPERKSSKTSTTESGGGGRAATNSSEVPIDLECEPMYDTVAPDQEDDYVLLLDETNQTSSSNNSLSKKDLSSYAGDITKHSEAANVPTTSSAANTSNNDAATIKSQTSIISGHSIATTTSSGTSDTEGYTGSPLPHDSSSKANYVNIDYFLCKSKRKDSRASGESEEDEPALMRAISYDQEGDLIGGDGEVRESNLEIFDIDSGVFGGSSVDSALGPSGGTGSVGRGDSRAGTEGLTMTAAEQEKYAMFRFMLTNIAESESAYVEVLNVMIKYMTALKATLKVTTPVLQPDDFNIIFYKIPELLTLHQKFLLGLQQTTPGMTVGKHFENLAREICVYGAFLQNYSRAVDTVRKCSQNNTEFAEITRSIRLRSLNKNQVVSLETLLYSPVSRIQKNIEIIEDLLKCLPESHPDHKSLKSALREFQSFLSDFKMIQPEQLFQGQGNPRHLESSDEDHTVKNSFIVELSEGHRKLRHLFLFNDVLVCAKYKASGKGEKFTFELKWYIPVSDCVVVDEGSTEPRESAAVNLVALRSQASTVRDQIKRQTSRDDPKKAKAEKQRKKLAELEAQLVLASPNLVFKVKGNGRAFTFFLSSEFERSQWVDAIETLKSGQLSSSTQLSMHELQSWLTSCRKHLKTNMGSYLLRTGRDETLLVGDFYVLIKQLKGILRPADLYICLEVDSYGHFFRKAKTKMICESTQPCWNQDFVIELEGAQNLRILLYEDHPRQGTLIRAKTTIELSRNWLTSSMNERKIDLQDYVLTMSTKFVPSEMTIRRVPTAKPSGLYGAKITQVCRREQRQVPFIMTSCVREVERRGINEVGIYRVSGSASDVSRLKKAFETNSYEAEQLLKDVDIHSVTGALKMYMRELPEALFTDDLYPRFFEAFNLPDPELKRKTLMQLFSTLPPLNQHIIMFLLDHMTRVNGHENHNKMSLHNMATVFGPTLLRPGAKSEGSGNIDLLAAGTVDVMAQAGILYFFLSKRASGELITSI